MEALQSAATVTGLVATALTIEREFRERFHAANTEPASQFQRIGRIRETPRTSIVDRLSEYFARPDASGVASAGELTRLY